jgi:uncharacterized cofD-like protein
MKNQKRVVAVGGGTGTSTVIHALHQIVPTVDISAVVCVSDSGGSTKRLRDEFGFQAIGDLRQTLAALASEQTQEWVRSLLLYRFHNGKELLGHNLGNLILTALQDMTGSTEKSLTVLQDVFHLKGHIIPVTDIPVDLQITYKNGTVVTGEDILDGPAPKSPIDHVDLTPNAVINADARKSLLMADLIIIGPGDLYGSLMACLAVEGMKETLQQTKAEIVYITNLMTKAAQTKDMSAAKHLSIIEKAIGRPCEYIFINTQKRFDKKYIEYYEKMGEEPVKDDLDLLKKENIKRKVFRDSFARPTEYTQSAADTIHRSVLRHDTTKLSIALTTILQTQNKSQ